MPAAALAGRTRALAPEGAILSDCPVRRDRPDSLDAMQAAPADRKVLLEHTRVRVLEAWVGAGDSVLVHTPGWPSVLHVLGVSDFVDRDPAGQAVLDTRGGAPLPEVDTLDWSTPLAPHSLNNVGTREIRVIAIEVQR